MSNEYDVVVAGAGIHGAGVAQAAAAAGYRTLVLEQRAAAWGTSSRSSKLIHGGLRYLENLELGLVRECLQERELLLRLAPDLVALRHFYIPLYRDTRRRPWQLRAGLSLYALLGGLGKDLRFRSLPRRMWSQLDGLRTDRLQAVFEYQDGQTDDAALTRAVLHSAGELGAEALMPAEILAVELLTDSVELSVRAAGREQRVRCRVLANCTGPWVKQLEARITPHFPAPDIELVQGTHVLLDTPAAAGIYYLEVPEDGRAVFVMPWRDKTLVGTTETPFTSGDPALAAPHPEERVYLQRAVNHYFPNLPWHERESFAGLRVLPKDARRPFERGRELLLARDRPKQPRVIGMYGGKLTSYRADAAKVMQHLHQSLPVRRAYADTRELPLKPVD